MRHLEQFSNTVHTLRSGLRMLILVLLAKRIFFRQIRFVLVPLFYHLHAVGNQCTIPITTCYSIWLYRLLSTVGLLSLSFQDKRWLCTKMVSVTAHFCQFSPEAETNLEFYQQQQIAKRGIFSQCFCWSWLCILGSSSWLEDTALSTSDVWQIFRLVLPHPPDCNMSFVAHHNFTSPKVPLPERAS